MLINDKRALAYTAKIDEIRPIEGYDRVEHARVGGWWVIVAKNDNFKVGDLCVYFEVDSKCNENDERFAFLEKRHYKIKTIKMCKVFSQGLIMPLAAFPEVTATEVNVDLTDILKVTYTVDEDNSRKNDNPNAKYESMRARHKKFFKTRLGKWLMKRAWGRKLCFLFLGKKKDNPNRFPTKFVFVHKTDEERVENIPWILENKQPFMITEKLDGTSCTYILERKGRKKFEFYVCSRNIRMPAPDSKCFHDYNIYWELAEKYHIYDNLKKYLVENPQADYVCIQGEGVGNVQGNPLKLDEDALYVFNFIDSNGAVPFIVAHNYILEWGMNWVPILDWNYILPDDMETFKDYATAKSVVNPDVFREGIVVRRPQDRISFKNVSREYLLAHNG